MASECVTLVKNSSNCSDLFYFLKLEENFVILLLLAGKEAEGCPVASECVTLVKNLSDCTDLFSLI